SHAYLGNATALPITYALSLHDALPIWPPRLAGHVIGERGIGRTAAHTPGGRISAARRVVPHHIAEVLIKLIVSLLPATDELGVGDRKSTRLNSSHVKISYAVYCLKKKK